MHDMVQELLQLVKISPRKPYSSRSNGLQIRTRAGTNDLQIT